MNEWSQTAPMYCPNFRIPTLNLQRPKMMEHDADICAVAMAKQKCPVKAFEKTGQVKSEIKV